MGLSLGVGILDQLRESDEEGYESFRKAFDRLSAFVAAKTGATWQEPERMDIRLPPHVSSFPYSYLHYLRRAFAHARKSKIVPPCPPGASPSKDRSSTPS